MLITRSISPEQSKSQIIKLNKFLNIYLVCELWEFHIVHIALDITIKRVYNQIIIPL